MSHIEGKYRGTTTYARVYRELVTAAEFRGVTTYQHIAMLMGLPTQGNLMGKEVGQMLGEVSEDEINAGRPMLSAVVVSTTGSPGEGFYGFAEEHRQLRDGEKRTDAWRRIRDSVYEAWVRPVR